LKFVCRDFAATRFPNLLMRALPKIPGHSTIKLSAYKLWGALNGG